MSILSPVTAARNAVPSPVRTDAPKPSAQSEFQSAYDACKAHPAYADAVAIRDALDKLRALCDEFAERYAFDTIRVYLRNLGFRSKDLSDDFAHVHRDVLGAVWVLDLIRAGIEPSLILPFDLGEVPAPHVTSAKGGAV